MIKNIIFSLTALIATSNFAYADCVLPPEAQAGKVVSAQCKACHEFDATKASKATGPNNHDVYGSMPGSRTDFSYSEAIKGAAAKKAVWNDATLNEYLENPEAYLSKVNGAPVKAKMMFKLADPQKRKDVIAWLKAIKGQAACS
jgi:cytochrome c